MFQITTSIIISMLLLEHGIKMIDCQISTACINVPNGINVRNSKSCSWFFSCNAQQATPMSCPETLQFHQDFQICDFPQNIDCTACSEHGIQNLADPNDCGKYFECIFGQRTHVQCPLDQLFDSELGTCNNKNNVKCDNALNICNNYPNSVTNVPDENDCASFYKCVYGVAHHQSCPADLFWSQSYQHCVPFENSDCYEHTETTSEITCTTIITEPTTQEPSTTEEPSTSAEPTTTQEPSTTEEPSTERPTTEHTTTITTTIEPNIPTCCEPFSWQFENNCPRIRFEYQAVPGRCRRYIACVLGIPIPNICLFGRFWDENRNRCVNTRPNCNAAASDGDLLRYE